MSDVPNTNGGRTEVGSVPPPSALRLPSSVAPSLDRVQQWMQAVITHPHGVEAGLASTEASRHMQVPLENVEQIISRSAALTSLERLNVYANAYYARLLECLSEEYPALRHAVGEDAFGGFALGYLQRFPSISHTLADLGRDFPRYLAETRPARQSAETGTADWADFLIDLSLLERTYSEVFDGPGPERGDFLKPVELLAIDPADWPHARLVPLGSFRLLSLRFPAHEYASQVRRQGQAVPPAATPTWLAITRRDYIVRRYPLSLDQYTLLLALSQGRSVGQAIEQVAAQSSDDLESLAARLRDWFRIWTAAPLFRAVAM